MLDEPKLSADQEADLAFRGLKRNKLFWSRAVPACLPKSRLIRQIVFGMDIFKAIGSIPDKKQHFCGCHPEQPGAYLSQSLIPIRANGQSIPDGNAPQRSTALHLRSGKQPARYEKAFQAVEPTHYSILFRGNRVLPMCV